MDGRMRAWIDKSWKDQLKDIFAKNKWVSINFCFILYFTRAHFTFKKSNYQISQSVNSSFKSEDDV